MLWPFHNIVDFTEFWIVIAVTGLFVYKFSWLVKYLVIVLVLGGIVGIFVPKNVADDVTQQLAEPKETIMTSGTWQQLDANLKKRGVSLGKLTGLDPGEGVAALAQSGDPLEPLFNLFDKWSEGDTTSA